MLTLVFPAHAGMSRVAALLETVTAGFPRSRGDEPILRIANTQTLTFSPLTRG